MANLDERVSAVSSKEGAEPGYGRRRTERILLSIPIRVEGESDGGQKFSEVSRTRVINRHGARILLKHRVVAGATLKIHNLLARLEAAFRVVGPTEPADEQGGEWGVECCEDRKNIWGIEFPPPLHDNSRGSALLECHSCHSQVVVDISLVELDVLDTSGLLARDCRTCRRLSSWSYAESPQKMTALPRDAAGDSHAAPVANQRFHRRAALRLPIRIRDYYGGVELTRSENVSKSGLCFASEKAYEVGGGILVTCPFDARGDNIEVKARVVRFEPIAGSSQKFYGVRYEQTNPQGP